MKAQLTPPSNFILPLLEELEKVGGSTRKQDIYQALEKRMELSEADMKLSQDGLHNYHIQLNHLVGRMRKAGLLEPGAGDNTLTITSAGLQLIGK